MPGNTTVNMLFADAGLSGLASDLAAYARAHPEQREELVAILKKRLLLPSPPVNGHAEATADAAP